MSDEISTPQKYQNKIQLIIEESSKEQQEQEQLKNYGIELELEVVKAIEDEWMNEGSKKQGARAAEGRPERRRRPEKD